MFSILQLRHQRADETAVRRVDERPARRAPPIFWRLDYKQCMAVWVGAVAVAFAARTCVPQVRCAIVQNLWRQFFFLVYAQVLGRFRPFRGIQFGRG